jgi:hypothetical protein
MAPAVARSGCWASGAPRLRRPRLYRRSANLLATCGRMGAPRGRQRPTYRGALRGAVRRRGVPDILGMHAGMGKGRPWRAGPRAARGRARTPRRVGPARVQQARGAACTRERVLGRFLFGVPLSERVKLQNFVQKCTKW